MSLSDLKLSLVLQLADRVTGPARKVNKAAKVMADRMKGTKDALKTLQEQSRQIQHFNQLNGKLGDTSGKLAEARRELDYFKRQVEIGGKAGLKLFGKDIDKLNARVAKLTAQETKLKRETDQVGKGLHKAGIDTARLSDAQAKLEASARHLNTRLDKQSRLYNRLKQMPHALAARWQSAAEKMKRTALFGGAALAGATAVGLPALNTAADFEDYQAVLKVIEGSQAKAKASMAWVENFATKTPYQLADVTAAFVQLRAYGLDPTTGLLKTLGDTSAGMNKPLMQSVEAIADAITGENERLKELGIKARADGKLFRYSYSDKKGVQRELAAMKDDRKSIEAALRKIWDEKFGGAMAEKSKTWRGILSNILDMWAKIQRMVMGSGPFEALKQKATALLDKLNKMAASGELQAWATRVGAKIKGVIDYLGTLLEKAIKLFNTIKEGAATLAEFAGGWQNLALIVAGLKLLPLVSALVSLTNVMIMAAPAVISFGAALMANPITAAAALIGAAAWLIYDNWDAISKWFGEKIAWWKSVGTTFRTIGEAMINGLTQGIEAKWDALKQKVQDLGKLLPDWLKKRLDIHSPSRVFARIGGHISEGVGQGIDARAGAAVAAVRRLGDTLPRALPTALAAGLTASAAVASPAAPQAVQPVVINATIHVHAAPGMDEAAIGRAVAKQIEELRREAKARARSRLYDQD